MADNNPSIVLDGDVSPFRQKLREAAADLKKFGDEGKTSFERMTGPLGALQEKFVAVGALLAGGAVFQAAVQITKEWTEQSVDLGAALGITATEAGNLKAALADEGVEMTSFMAAAQKLAANLKNDEEALQAVGLATRDVAGNLRPLNELTIEAIELTNDYKAGTDRAIAASIIFGKGFEIAGDLAKVNSQLLAENTERQRELAATVTQESVAAFEEYDAASKGVAATLRALQQAIGNALMPVLATLANWFVSVGPSAVTVIKGAFGGLISVFWGVKYAAELAWNAFALTIEVATINALRFADVASSALRLDFDGAKSAWERGGDQIQEVMDKRLRNVVEGAQNTREKLWNLFATGAPTEGAAVGGRSANALVKSSAGQASGKESKAPVDPSMMSYYEAALSEEKRLASEKDALRDYTKEEERAFWQTLLNFASLNAKDRVTIEKKVSDLTVAIRRQEAKEKQDLDAEAVRMGEATALGRVDAEAAAAQAAVSNSQMSKLQLAQLEMQFEQQRLEIQRAALQERLLLLDRDPNVSPVERQRLQNQIEQLEQQHGIRMIHLQSRVAQESGQIWDDLSGRMSSLWDKGVNAMMNGTLRWKNAFKAIGMELVSWFATSVVGEQVKVFLAGQVKQLAIKMGFLGQEKTAQTIASSHIVTTKGNEAISVSTANAVEAGTGAAGAMAPTPFVGPVLALAAMAAVFAAVMAMGSKVKSASKGFDIPKGMNPMTQLHEEEMVLPAAHAEVIRRLAAGEGGGSSNSTPIVNLNFTSAYQDRAGIKRFFSDNSPAVAEAIRKAMRDFHGR